MKNVTVVRPSRPTVEPTTLFLTSRRLRLYSVACATTKTWLKRTLWIMCLFITANVSSRAVLFLPASLHIFHRSNVCHTATTATYVTPARRSSPTTVISHVTTRRLRPRRLQRFLRRRRLRRVRRRRLRRVRERRPSCLCRLRSYALPDV